MSEATSAIFVASDIYESQRLQKFCTGYIWNLNSAEVTGQVWVYRPVNVLAKYYYTHLHTVQLNYFVLRGSVDFILPLATKSLQKLRLRLSSLQIAALTDGLKKLTWISLLNTFTYTHTHHRHHSLHYVIKPLSFSPFSLCCQNYDCVFSDTAYTSSFSFWQGFAVRLDVFVWEDKSSGWWEWQGGRRPGRAHQDWVSVGNQFRAQNLPPASSSSHITDSQEETRTPPPPFFFLGRS